MKKNIFFVMIVFLLGCFGSDSFYGYKDVFAGEEREEELPIYAIEAQNGLQFMFEKIRGRSLYLLGDASHGTEEFYGFRKQVTRHLIREFGLRIVVLEAEWDSSKLIDYYINGDLSDNTGPRVVLAEAFGRWPQWVWANEELVEFVLWLKDFNHGKPPSDRVHCYGMDMQLAVDGSLDFLSKQFSPDSAAWQKQAVLADWWRAYADDPIRYKERIAAGTEKPNLLATELLDSIDNPEIELRRVLTMLIAAEKYYRVMAIDNYKAWNVRARHMAGYVSELIENDPSENGVVVWAHNSHVGDMSSSGTEGDGLINLGQLMRQEIGRENVFILGSGGYEGSVLAALNWGGTVQEFTVPPARQGSIEYLLHSADWDNPLLFWETEEQRRQWDVLLLHRGIGVVYDPEDEDPGNYLTANFSRRYDAFVFWKKTRALRRLSNP